MKSVNIVNVNIRPAFWHKKYLQDNFTLFIRLQPSIGFYIQHFFRTVVCGCVLTPTPVNINTPSICEHLISDIWLSFLSSTVHEVMNIVNNNLGQNGWFILYNSVRCLHEVTSRQVKSFVWLATQTILVISVFKQAIEQLLISFRILDPVSGRGIIRELFM